jgi:hypothetical protein
MDFALLAIALNLSKLTRKRAKAGKNPENQPEMRLYFVSAKVLILKTKHKSVKTGTFTKIAA